ncbi:MAG TPA: hypothetical protein VNM72_02580 [Blastocatellia bacterium]|nr:hypothetical protein [Blastocatellia bacterium]
MFKLRVTTFKLLITMALSPTLVNAQQSPLPTIRTDPASMAAGFADVSFWITLLVTLVAGAVGGVVYELLILQGNIEFPHKPLEEEITEKYPYAIAKYMYDLGIWARVIIGALAAVAAVFVLSPNTNFGLLATAVVAGSAGMSVFRSLQDRLLASLAQKDAADAMAEAERMSAKVDEVIKAFTDLKSKIVTASTSPPGSRTLAFEAGKAILDLEDLDRVDRLLSEARGIHRKIR